MARLFSYPSYLGQFFRTPPAAGNTHRWLLSAANKLKKSLPPEAAVQFLYSYCRTHVSHRQIPMSEIQRAVYKSHDLAQDFNPNGTGFKWPAKAPNLIETVLNTFKSPPFDFQPKAKTEHLLPQLFRPGELLCFGPTQAVAKVAPLELALEQASNYQFLVPNPMKGMFGKSKDGKDSARCQDNVRLRRFIITEIDDPGLPLEAQARIIHFLQTRAKVRVPLAAVVWSGGKSLHAWWKVEGIQTDHVLQFFTTACFLGADPSLWDFGMWVRMPGGTRVKGEERIHQTIVFKGE